MEQREAIISLVKIGFNFTFEYINNEQAIVFTKTGYRSKPILMKDLNLKAIDEIKTQI